MQFEFTKMQSLGNDFVVLDGVTRSLPMNTAIAKLLSDRHFGIGCDQILLAEKGRQAEFRFRIFNQDGGEVEQCGNGARCFARFLRDRELTDKDVIGIETMNARMQLAILDNGDVAVEMGVPEFVPLKIPFEADAAATDHEIVVGEELLRISALAIGNPHAVVQVADSSGAPVNTLGPLVECHPRFPARVNVGFSETINSSHIRLRVYERGVGETLGCGSGACAAVVAGIRLGLLDREVRVSLPGGDALVRWNGDGEPVHLIGPAYSVFSGTIKIPDDLLNESDAA